MGMQAACISSAGTGLTHAVCCCAADDAIRSLSFHPTLKHLLALAVGPRVLFASCERDEQQDAPVGEEVDCALGSSDLPQCMAALPSALHPDSSHNITSVAFSPDGVCLAFGSNDGKVRPVCTCRAGSLTACRLGGHPDMGVCMIGSKSCCAGPAVFGHSRGLKLDYLLACKPLPVSSGLIVHRMPLFHLQVHVARLAPADTPDTFLQHAAHAALDAVQQPFAGSPVGSVAWLGHEASPNSQLLVGDQSNSTLYIWDLAEQLLSHALRLQPAHNAGQVRCEHADTSSYSKWIEWSAEMYSAAVASHSAPSCCPVQLACTGAHLMWHIACMPPDQLGPAAACPKC